MTELTLVYEFFKTGLFAVGGGLATIPFLKGIAERYDWFTASELMDMIAVGESTPGPIGINIATYAGINAAGLHGAVIATLSLVLPSVIVITIISKFLQKFRRSRMVENVFYGLRPASAALIAAAVFPVFLSSVVSIGDGFHNTRISPAAIIIYLVFTPLCFWGAGRKKPIHPILFIAMGAILGILFGKYLEL